MLGRRRKCRILRQRGRQMMDFLMYPSSVPSAYDSSVLAVSGAIQIVTRGLGALFLMCCSSLTGLLDEKCRSLPLRTEGGGISGPVTGFTARFYRQ